MPRAIVRPVLWIIFIAMSAPAGKAGEEGTVSFAGAIIVTPDAGINAQLHGGKLDPAEVVDVRAATDGINVNPLLRKGWTWMAAKGIRAGGKPLSFFFMNGRLYSDVNLKTLHRRMKFQKDVSASVRSKAFVVAFYREFEIERELMVFTYSQAGRPDSVRIGVDIFGEEKTVAINPDHEGKAVVGLLKMADEFRPWYLAGKEVGARSRISFNRGWKFAKGAHPGAYAVNTKTDLWEAVDVPHCWNATDVYDSRNVFDGYEINTWYYRGPGWYRKEFTLGDEFRGRRVWVTFEGAFQKADVWLNGKALGRHTGGYTGFTFEMTGSLAPGGGKNVLAVKVDNSYDVDIPPHSADYAMYGGLYRDVYVTATDRIALAGAVRVNPAVRGGRDGEITVSATVDNATRNVEAVEVKNVLVNPGNEIVASFSQMVTVPALKARAFSQSSGVIRGVDLWSPDRPVLYTLHTTIVRGGRLVDHLQTRIGFRWYSFDPDSGFFLNGERLRLQGVNRHQDYPMLGIALPDSLHVRDMALIKELGANFVRLAHYPQDPSVLDACDSLGLLVWEEIPVVNSVGGPEFTANARTMMREMIERDANHPSIILWGIANECLMNFAESGAVSRVRTLLTGLHALAKELDPVRLTAQAHNDLLDGSIADITDVLGRNRYFGWYTENMADFGPELEKEHRENPKRVLLISEYGAESKRGYHVDHPKRFDHSEDYQLQFHEYYWETIRSAPYVAGSLVWAGFDFGSPFKVGNIPRINQKGIWDAWRQPKDLYYFYRSQWSTDPMVYIVSHTRRQITGPENGPISIRVYSNCSAVELFVNGKSIGKQEGRRVSLWDVILNRGPNTLRAVGTSPTRLVEDVLHIRYSVQ